MIVKLIDCSDCDKRHGDHYLCSPDPEAFSVRDQNGREIATASSLAGAALAASTVVAEGQATKATVVERGAA